MPTCRGAGRRALVALPQLVRLPIWAVGLSMAVTPEELAGAHGTRHGADPAKPSPSSGVVPSRIRRNVEQHKNLCPSPLEAGEPELRLREWVGRRPVR